MIARSDRPTDVCCRLVFIFFLLAGPMGKFIKKEKKKNLFLVVTYRQVYIFFKLSFRRFFSNALLFAAAVEQMNACN